MPRVPLELWNRPHWELNGRPDSGLFFRRLPAALPTATTLFVEGCALAPDVEQFLRSAAEPGEYLPKRQTLWPRPKRYRIPCDGRTLAALSSLAQRHAEPELLDHLFVYAGSTPLLEYPDAFGRGAPVFISSQADERCISDFAAVLGLELVRLGPR